MIRPLLFITILSMTGFLAGQKAELTSVLTKTSEELVGVTTEKTATNRHWGSITKSPSDAKQLRATMIKLIKGCTE